MSWGCATCGKVSYRCYCENPKPEEPPPWRSRDTPVLPLIYTHPQDHHQHPDTLRYFKKGTKK